MIVKLIVVYLSKVYSCGCRAKSEGWAPAGLISEVWVQGLAGRRLASCSPNWSGWPKVTSTHGRVRSTPNLRPRVELPCLGRGSFFAYWWWTGGGQLEATGRVLGGNWEIRSGFQPIEPIDGTTGKCMKYLQQGPARPRVGRPISQFHQPAPASGGRSLATGPFRV